MGNCLSFKPKKNLTVKTRVEHTKRHLKGGKTHRRDNGDFLNYFDKLINVSSKDSYKINDDALKSCIISVESL